MTARAAVSSATARVAKFIDDYTSDPTGATDSTAAFNRAVAALPRVTINSGAGGTSASYPVGRIMFGMGTYKLGAIETTDLGPFVGVDGPGQVVCLINYVGSGRCFKTVNTVYGTNGDLNLNFAGLAPYTNWSPRIDGFTLDGSGASGTAIGLWIGDVEGAQLGPSLTIQNFAGGTGKIGLLFYSANSWHEKLTGSVNIYNCDTLVQNGVAAPTHAYSGDLNYSDLRFNIFADANQDVFAQYGGASLYHGSLQIRGNTCEASVNTGAVIRLAGGATLDTSRIEVMVETQAINPRLNGSAAGTATHQTIAFADPTSDQVKQCWGVLDFHGYSTNTNWVRSATNKPFSFDGLIHGDASLNPAYGQQNPPPPVPFTSTMYRTVPRGYYNSAASTIDLSTGSYFDLGQLAANLTLLFGNCESSAARRIFIRVQQGSNQKTITWPTSGSPSIASPTVLWKGSIPPVLSRTNGTVDLFELWTMDGSTWFGEQVPAYSTVGNPTYSGSHRNAVSSSTSSQVLNPTANTVTGSTLVVCVANLTPASGATPTIIDSKSNTWVVDKTVGSAGAVLWLAHAVNSSALTTSDSITVTWSAPTAAYANFHEFTGLTNKTLDVSGTADNGVSTAASIAPSLSANTNAPAEMAVLFVACGNSNTGNPASWAANNLLDPMGPWTVVDSGGRPGAVWVCPIPAPGTQVKGTITPSGSQPMTALIATYS